MRMKRILCLILAAVLLAVLTPVSAMAAEVGVYVTVRTTQTEADGTAGSRNLLIYAIENGGDLLFDARTLADITGFDLTRLGNVYTFTRGRKVVSVNLDTSKVKLYDSQNPTVNRTPEAALPSPVVQRGSQVYLSVAGMLPRLNVTCSLEDGLLTVLPTAVSVWDELIDVKLGDYKFDMEFCAEVLDITEDEVKELAYGRYDAVDAVVGGIAPEFADTHDYYVILDRFFKDETAADEAGELVQDAAKITGFMAKNPEEISELAELVCPGSGELFNEETLGNLNDKVEKMESALELLTYYNLFNRDNSQKIKVLRSLIDSSAHGSNPPLEDAAKQAVSTYDNFWLGLIYKYGYDWTYGLVESLTFDDFREQFRVDYMGQLPDNLLLELTPYFESLMDRCLSVYYNRFQPDSRESLEAWYAHAMLYFYSVEQIYLGWVNHVTAIKGGQLEDYQAFGQTAARMEKMYAKYLTASLYINTDLFDNTFFELESKEYLQSLPHVTRTKSGGSAVQAVEYGLYLKAMWEMGITQMDWTMEDIDGDGAGEMMACWSDGMAHVVVMDGWTIDTWDFPLSDFDSLTCLKTAQGQVVLRHDHVSGYDDYVTFYTWKNTGWEPSAQHFEDDTYTGYFWAVDNAAAREAEYNSRVAPYLAAEAMRFNYMSPDERTIAGDAAAMIGELNGHFHERAGFVKSLQMDVNGDLFMDRVYLLCDAADLWTNLLEPPLEIYGPGPLHGFKDRLVTVVLAENYGSQLRLRVQRLELPYMDAPTLLSEASAAGTALKLGTGIYHYQAMYEAFSSNPMYGDVAWDSLIGMTKNQVRARLKNYTEWIGDGQGIAQGYLDGLLVQVWYASHYGEAEGEDTVLSANPLEHYPSVYSICDTLEPGMDVFTIVRTIYPELTLSTPWRAVQVVEDSDGTRLSKTTCYYMEYESGNMYLLTLLYPYDQQDPMPTALYAELIEEDIPVTDDGGELDELRKQNRPELTVIPE